ncbi:hypothetical protein G6R29_05130 [Fructobacillus sp. M2-14]|uniref:Uncharacterized protein n=1 Tax=Fructobacillus broussonetiae TaxID=2713173 RepID=A0ABS5R1V0_9LACO|nr:hypothetical protein [Fructobacillus broussonetiae]MBS9339002.1 hypothetical protein [Fructobacillus broussonetiae]
MTVKTKEERLSYYYELLDMTYADAVKALLVDHGEVAEDFFIKDRYNKWEAGDVETPEVNSANSRTDEGLEIHHIAEDKYEDMGNPVAIQEQVIPYSFKKPRPFATSISGNTRFCMR